MLQTVANRLSRQPDVIIQQNSPMKNITSFQVGGPADLLVCPETVDALIACRRILKEGNIPTTVIGAGSNLLVSDAGIRGAVLRLAKPFSRITVDGNTVTAEAGVSLARLANEALAHSLTGLEFASGIPGSLGGAVFMNAGAYGGEMKDVVIETTYIDAEGNIEAVSGEAHGFGYRKSIFCGTENIILSSRLVLAKGNPDKIRATMLDLNGRRKEKQPLNFPSAGSTFKRPTGYFAGKLIEDAGLKGFTVGGAQVSEKHAGFVINKGSATADDIYKLMQEVSRIVFEKFGVTLEPEVRMLGEF